MPDCHCHHWHCFISSLPRGHQSGHLTKDYCFQGSDVDVNRDCWHMSSNLQHLQKKKRRSQTWLHVPVTLALGGGALQLSSQLGQSNIRLPVQWSHSNRVEVGRGRQCHLLVQHVHTWACAPAHSYACIHSTTHTLTHTHNVSQYAQWFTVALLFCYY